MLRGWGKPGSSLTDYPDCESGFPPLIKHNPFEFMSAAEKVGTVCEHGAACFEFGLVDIGNPTAGRRGMGSNGLLTNDAYYPGHPDHPELKYPANIDAILWFFFNHSSFSTEMANAIPTTVTRLWICITRFALKALQCTAREYPVQKHPL